MTGESPAIGPERSAPFDYLRLSVTGRCQLSCAYCRPDKSEAGHELPLGTLVELCRLLCRALPIRKIRLTGGEPLLRPDLPELVSALAGLPLQPEITLTTNGLLLEQRAKQLREAGLSRVNVSIPSPDPEIYTQLTGVPALDRVLRGLAAVRSAGFERTKINTVLTSRLDADQMRELLAVAVDNAALLRFIEVMPLGLPSGLYDELFVPASAALALLRRVAHLTAEVPGDSAHSSHPRFAARLADGRLAIVEMITPVSRPFCSGCRRLRVTRDGWLLPCLLSPVRLPLVRPDGTLPEPADLLRPLRMAAELKGRAGMQVHEGMWAIGG